MAYALDLLYQHTYLVRLLDSEFLVEGTVHSCPDCVFLSSIFVFLASINYRAKLRATVVCNFPAIESPYSEPPFYLTHPLQANIFTGLTPRQVGTAPMPQCPSQLFKPVSPKLFSRLCLPFHPETPVKAVVYPSPLFLSASLGTSVLSRWPWVACRPLVPRGTVTLNFSFNTLTSPCCHSVTFIN